MKTTGSSSRKVRKTNGSRGSCAAGITKTHTVTTHSMTALETMTAITCVIIDRKYISRSLTLRPAMRATSLKSPL